MKKYLLALLISFGLFSCIESEGPNELRMPQQWTLIGYKSSWVANPPLEPITDSIYNYSLKRDGTFVKNIGKYRLSGTWDLEIGQENEKYVTLAYDQASLKQDEEYGSWGLIHYCGQSYEIFTVIDKKTVVGSWGQCDGPNLYFSRQ